MALAQAKRSLVQGDTLGAIETMHEWSSTHEVGQEFIDFLGWLHLPDEPLDSVSVPQELSRIDNPDRRWRMRVDGSGLSSSDLSWDLGTMLLSRLGETRMFGAPMTVDIGFASMFWSGAEDKLGWGIDPLVGIALSAGTWDLRLDGWSGVFDSQWELGSMAVVSKVTVDSFGLRRRLGGILRGSRLGTSLVGGFCHWDKLQGDWIWEAKGDLRLRHDPVASINDSLVIRGTRLQAIARGLVLYRLGKWAMGPSLDIDTRTSLASDSWLDEKGAHRESVRQDASFTAAAVVRLSAANGLWGEGRLGWTEASINSSIDQDFSDRNTGMATNVGLGLSF